MQPIVNGLEREYGDKLAFEQWRVDDEPGNSLFKKYALRGHPSYVLAGQNGEVLWTLQGQTTGDVLAGQIDRVLGTQTKGPGIGP